MTTVLVAAMLLPAGLLVLLAGRRLLVVITVVGHSMQPTYQPGDRLLMLRSRRLALRPGAVVVFAPPRQPYGGGGEQVPPSFLQPGELLVKRVVAGPGDATPEPVLASPGAQERVPAGHVVVLSDLQGYDSRFFGYLPLDEVRGVILAGIRSSSPRSPRRLALHRNDGRRRLQLGDRRSEPGRGRPSQ